MKKSQIKDRLGVYLHGFHIGNISQNPHGLVRFVPESGWLAANRRPVLGIRFLDSTRHKAHGTLPPWFENLLPESDNFWRTWQSQKLGIHSSDSWSLLAALGSDLPGAVEIRTNRIEPGNFVSKKVARSSNAATRPIRFSLSGVQLKFSMVLKDDRFCWPAADENGDWIVKIPGQRFSELVEVEFATMTWARAVGLCLPGFHIVPVDMSPIIDSELLAHPSQAFAVARFDRVAGEKVHQEDFAQVFGISPMHKYGETGGTGRFTYESMARVLRDVAGNDQLEEFIRRLAFVIGSGNGDAHLKNWSLQWPHSGLPVLSPCYDQVSTIAWKDFGWESAHPPTLALRMGGIERFDVLDADTVARFAASIGEPSVPELLRDTLAAMRIRWPETSSFAPQRMQRALKTHWKDVPLLREIGNLQ